MEYKLKSTALFFTNAHYCSISTTGKKGQRFLFCLSSCCRLLQCHGRIYCISWFCRRLELENFRSSFNKLLSSRRWRCNLINKHQTNWEGKTSKISEVRNCKDLKNRFEMDLVNFTFLGKLLKFSVKTGLLQSSISILCKLFLRFPSVL